MRLLIDTHALLWFCEGSPNMSPKTRAAMEDDSNQCFVSHASLEQTRLGSRVLGVGVDEDGLRKRQECRFS